MIGQDDVDSEKPLTDMAWTILEAANDLGDHATVEACRRIVDASYRGENQAQSDLNVMFRFFE
jgi:hypothetical protein